MEVARDIKPENNFLKKVRKLTEQKKIPLILLKILTGKFWYSFLSFSLKALINLGRYNIPSFAIATVTIAICKGLVKSSPCPIDILHKSKTFFDFSGKFPYFASFILFGSFNSGNNPLP